MKLGKENTSPITISQTINNWLSISRQRLTGVIPRVEDKVSPERQTSGKDEALDEDIKDIIARYDWDAELMYKIAIAESEKNPNAINHKDEHRTCSGSFGIMQLSCENVEKYGIWDSWNNPEINISVAYKVWTSQGLRAWGAYMDGRYLKSP